MKRIIKIIVLLLTVMHSFNMVYSAEIKPLYPSGTADPYSMINNVTLLQIKNNSLTIRVFETGGGDPVMNGNKLIINISDWDFNGNSYTWDSGINIYEVEKIENQNNKIYIKCTKHIAESISGKITTVDTEYSISYFKDEKNQLSDRISVLESGHEIEEKD